MKNIRKYSKNVCITFLMVVFLFSTVALAPMQARAQALTVPIGTSFDFNSIMAHLKDFTLDRLAVMVATQVLQRMTASVVDWINSGFNGSPAFLTNPEGFFMDTADNIAGEFIHEIGASAICSPFGLDIQLSLALNQVNYGTRNYACTLSAAVRNAQASIQRGPTFNVRTDARGATLQDLLNPSSLSNNPNALSINNRGVETFATDFQRGHWPVFLALTTEPQNNPNGAFLQAQADLNARIVAREQVIQNDLNRGNGFLSFEKCENVDMDGYNGEVTKQTLGISESQVSQLNNSGNQVINLKQGIQIKKRVDPQTNTTTFQNCQTQTPGSVIGGTLQRQLNVPQDKLVLVKTISDSIDAMLGALVNQMLSQGLAALSKAQSGGGGGKSYLRKLVDESNSSNSQNARIARNRLLNETSSLVDMASTTKSTYAQGTQILNNTKSRFLAARACYENKLSTLNLDANQRAYGTSQIATINATISVRIDPQLSAFTVKVNEVQARIDELRDAARTTTSDTDIPDQSADDIRGQVDRLENYLGNVTRTTRQATADSGAAKKELEVIEKQADGLNKEANVYLTNCAAFPLNVTAAGVTIP